MFPPRPSPGSELRRRHSRCGRGQLCGWPQRWELSIEKICVNVWFRILVLFSLFFFLAIVPKIGITLLWEMGEFGFIVGKSFCSLRSGVVTDFFVLYVVSIRITRGSRIS